VNGRAPPSSGGRDVVTHGLRATGPRRHVQALHQQPNDQRELRDDGGQDQHRRERLSRTEKRVFARVSATYPNAPTR